MVPKSSINLLCSLDKKRFLSFSSSGVSFVSILFRLHQAVNKAFIFPLKDNFIS